MTITTKSLEQIQQLLINNLVLSINNNQPDLKKRIDPNIKNSFIAGLVNSLSAGIDDNNQLLQSILKQLFPQTATGDYLKFWGELVGLNIKTATKGEGFVNFTGDVGVVIPANTILQKADDTEYQTLQDVVIGLKTITISNLIRIGNIATATTTSEHNLATGMTIAIAGANQTDYNKTTIINVISANQFTYQVDNAPITPATGTIIASANFTTAQVVARTSGTITNASNGTQLEFSSPLGINVDDIVFVNFNGIVGAIDDESEDNFRERVLFAFANNTLPFTNAGIKTFLIDEIEAITRVWVYDATPSPGYVSIYFVNDNETNIIPNSIQLQEAKSKIIDSITGIKPANTDDTMVLVLAPQPYLVNFVFSSLSPNTQDMKQAITERLTDYFRNNEVSLGKDITPATYNSVIASTIDSQGNAPSFVLSSPTATIDVASNQLPTLGSITFP